MKKGHSNLSMENQHEDKEREKKMKREIVERFFETEAAHGVKIIGPGGKERLEHEIEKAG
jgi:hypothetical protein